MVRLHKSPKEIIRGELERSRVKESDAASLYNMAVRESDDYLKKSSLARLKAYSEISDVLLKLLEGKSKQ